MSRATVGVISVWVSLAWAVVFAWWKGWPWQIAALYVLACVVALRWLEARVVGLGGDPFDVGPAPAWWCWARATVAGGLRPPRSRQVLRRLAGRSAGEAGLLARLEAAEAHPWRGYRRDGWSSPNAP